MGTSASYSGPNWPGTNDAVNSATQHGEINSPRSVANAVSAFARDSLNASRGQFSGLRSKGGRGFGTGSNTAKAGAGLARFLSTAQTSGLNTALNEINLDSASGKSVEDICDAITDALVEQNGLLDDASVRDAMSRTMEEICTGATTAEELEQLLQGNEVPLEDIIAKFYCHALQVNFENKEWNRVQERLSSADKARDFFQRSKDYIQSFVEYRLSKEVDLTKYNLHGSDAIHMAEELNNEILEAIGGDE